MSPGNKLLNYIIDRYDFKRDDLKNIRTQFDAKFKITRIWFNYILQSPRIYDEHCQRVDGKTSFYSIEGKNYKCDVLWADLPNDNTTVTREMYLQLISAAN